MHINIQPSSNIGELVSKDYRTAAVFKKHDIDFCCNGNRSIESACHTKNIPSNQLIQELEKSIEEPNDGQVNFQEWPLDLLADYIEKKHHRFVRQQVKEITPLLDKIVNVHGQAHPELLMVQKLFKEAGTDLTSHLRKEEKIVFPYIQQVLDAKENGNQVVRPPFGSIENPIAMMHEEHDTEGERFRKIAMLTNGYQPPLDACNTYKVTLAMIQAFEEDLHQHIHLENNILFPKVIALEQAG